MGLEHLLHQIEADSDRTAKSIRASAQQRAETIVSDAHASSRKGVESARAQAEEFCAAESRERVVAAQLEAQKMLSEAKDEAVRQNLQLVWERFSDLPSRAGYAKQLSAWAKSALDELDVSGSVLRCNKRDKKALESAGFKVAAEPLECAGGVRAESKDGRVFVDFTLEALFESRKEALSKRIYAVLFAHENPSEDFLRQFEPERKSKKRQG